PATWFRRPPGNHQAVTGRDRRVAVPRTDQRGRAMTFDSLRGPYTLNDPLVDQQTRRGPGVYLLGCQSADGRFRVQSIGCANDNLNAALKDRIGRYPQFKYLHLESRDAALACHRE